jgi:hypothetical protein
LVNWACASESGDRHAVIVFGETRPRPAVILALFDQFSSSPPLGPCSISHR